MGDIARFSIITGMLKAYEDTETQRKRFKTTASSTVKDLAGDEMTLQAIQAMASDARSGMTIFLNHSYNVPEDVLGTVEDAEVIQRGVDADGNPIIDLDFDIALNEANPRAVQAWDAIDRGVKLGTSIGAKVLHATKKKGGGLLIDNVKLLEASLVGIPANQRSWVHYATKALAGIDGSGVVVDEETVIAEAEPDKTDSTVNVAIHIDANKGDHLVNETDNSVDNSVESKTGSEEVEIEIEASFTPDDSAVGETDVDKTAATRITIEVVPDAQDAPPSTPGNARSAVADETADGDDEALGDNVTRAVETPEVIQGDDEVLIVRMELLDLKRQVRMLTAERDEARANLDLAKQLIDRISRLPLARKAQPTVSVAQDAVKYGGVIDPEVIKLLERKN
jgi:phage head maturation protease